MSIRCIFGFHKMNRIPTGEHPRCSRCNKKVGLYIQSLESPRFTSLNHMPVERRQAAIDSMLKKAK